MPNSPLLIEVAIAIPIVLGLAYVIARVIRWTFGARLRLEIRTMTIVSTLGISIGILLSGIFFYGLRLWMPTTILLAFGTSLGLSFAVAGLAAALNRGAQDVNVPALLAAGESDRVEFKETARWNVREDKKDPRMELAIAKTVAAFLNSSGGVLVIGANDAGEAIGLHRDLATLRTPDHDRFELWLRDLLSTLLGRNAAALPRIQFNGTGGTAVCAVNCPPSPKPVFLVRAKDGGSTDLWVRVGNSTRSLGVDEAVQYVAEHWRPSVWTWLSGKPAR
ncbi:AlbA family DNA-binding domain-containing protein [Microbacterium aquimaris]|uniref:ATP-binding protein n=1 Tax=Microbacterium aquimaris TaxID=459816 RepID=A0ABU5N2J7_9MICO|nr:ATP-binding protein [Microbacterium aquimaris]MDZ8160305.1 ATP-binding protein [Microbacterium aquimaris]